MTPLLGGIGAVVAIVLLGGLWFGGGSAATAAPEYPFGVVDETGVQPASRLTVHVSGAVVRPGLVVVPSGARIADVISAAGGALRTADLARLNLAAAVRDAEHIHVPIAVVDDGSSIDPGSDRGVDLNHADAAELEELPGVGPVLAQRIVAYREENGPYATIEDLLDVPGIGEAKLAQLRDAVGSP